MSSATTTAAQPLMTAEEFLKQYGDELNVDLVDGRVEYQPMPHRRHGTICNNVSFALTGFVRPNRLGRVMINDTFVTLDPPPELVFEVRSPSNTWAALVQKALDYLNAGVNVVVLIDADVESASVYRLNEVQQVFHNGDEFTLPDVLPGFAVPVRQFFADD